MCMHMCMHVWVHVHVCACICACECTLMCVCMCAYVCMYALHVCVTACACVHVYVLVSVHLCVCVHIRMHTCHGTYVEEVISPHLPPYLGHVSVVHHCVCQASWLIGFWVFPCLHLLSHHRITEITGRHAKLIVLPEDLNSCYYIHTPSAHNHIERGRREDVTQLGGYNLNCVHTVSRGWPQGP